MIFSSVGLFVHKIFFILQGCSHRKYQDDVRNIKRGNWERQIARNGKLQYLVQK